MTGVVGVRGGLDGVARNDLTGVARDDLIGVVHRDLVAVVLNGFVGVESNDIVAVALADLTGVACDDEDSSEEEFVCNVAVSSLARAAASFRRAAISSHLLNRS